jgi:EAL domain-containing protein (putative c-di-GMP-specific phosphodiesterase class I)/ActR/RegA family two-component response regulator
MQTILIVDDDDAVTDGLAEALQRPGRQLILCSDLESAQLAVEREVPACVVTDIRLSGPFRYEGLDFIDHIRRLSADTRIVVMTGARTEGLDSEALQRGAAVVLQKPFGPSELEACLPEPTGTGEPQPVRIPSLESVIASPLLRPSFQPIVAVSATADVAFGYESLARFYGAFFSNPAILFEYASRKGRLVELEMACIRRTLTEAMVLDTTPRIFVNVHPAVITSEVLARTLSLAIADSSIEAERIVLEITEQSSLGDSRMVRESCTRLRELGVSFALDDVGMAYSHLAHIEQIRPAFLKVSQDFGTDFELDATRTKIVKNVLSLANDFDCELILEGIETAQTRDAALGLGIRLAQGYFWGRPSPAAAWSSSGGASATNRDV